MEEEKEEEEEKQTRGGRREGARGGSGRETKLPGQRSFAHQGSTSGQRSFAPFAHQGSTSGQRSFAYHGFYIWPTLFCTSRFYIWPTLFCTSRFYIWPTPFCTSRFYSLKQTPAQHQAHFFHQLFQNCSKNGIYQSTKYVIFHSRSGDKG